MLDEVNQTPVSDAPLLLDYESRRARRTGKPPYSDRAVLGLGLTCVLIGVAACIAFSIAIRNQINDYGFRFADLPAMGLLGLVACSVLGYGTFALWMHGRYLRRKRTITAWEAAGKMTRWLIGWLN